MFRAAALLRRLRAVKSSGKHASVVAPRATADRRTAVAEIPSWLDSRRKQQSRSNTSRASARAGCFLESRRLLVVQS